nr:reverse transcriptase domain-containing protein [Tanacetum cinerariifolium]
NSPQREASPAIVEPLRIELPFLEDQFQENNPLKSPMADNRTMAKLLQAPTEGHVRITDFPSYKVRPSRAKAVVAKVGTSSSTPAISLEVAELKDMVRALLLDKKNKSPAPTPSSTPAPVKAVESNKKPSASLPNVKPSIPYPSRRDNEKHRDQANEQIEKFYEIFKEMSFEISFTDALILMPKFASTLKALIGNREKLSETAQTTMNEHCPTVILNKFPRKLDPRVPLILGRCFLKTSRALIDVHKGELTLPCEEYSQEVLGFLDVTDNGTLTPQNDPIVSITSPTLTLFGDSDFLLFEEADAFMGLEDDLDSLKINPFYYDFEGDIILLEAILNSKPSPPLPNQDQNLPSFKEELKAYEAQTVKSSVDEPPEVELKDLPHHLEYAFLEGDDKLPVIIAKELRSEEKTALIKV